MEILNQHEDRNGFGGRGRGRGGPGGGRGGPRGGFSGRGRGGGAGWPSGGGEGGEKTEYVMVPASKVGLVIGKGGETIKSINQASGAHTEIDKNAPPDAREKNFIIRGPPECVDRAKQMVMEKIGLVQVGIGWIDHCINQLHLIVFRVPDMGLFQGKHLTLTLLVVEVDLVGLGEVEVGEIFTNQDHLFNQDNQQLIQPLGSQTIVPSGPSTTGALACPERPT